MQTYIPLFFHFSSRQQLSIRFLENQLCSHQNTQWRPAGGSGYTADLFSFCVFFGTCFFLGSSTAVCTLQTFFFCVFFWDLIFFSRALNIFLLSNFLEASDFGSMDSQLVLSVAWAKMATDFVATFWRHQINCQTHAPLCAQNTQALAGQKM